MKTIGMILLLSALSTAAFAGVSAPGPVTMLQVYGTPSQNFNDVFVSTCPTSSGALTNCVYSTSCSKKTGFVIERNNSSTFKELYAAVLAARLAGVSIGLLGTGTCASNGAEILAEVSFPPE